VNGFLKFISLVNAAVWLGASLFFTLGVAPAVFSPEMKALLQHPYYPGAVAQLLFGRFFLLQYICGGIAIVLYLWESLYRGRKFERITFGLLIGILAIALIGGNWLQPKLKTLHQVQYNVRASETDKAAAKKLFGPLHGASQGVNFLVLAGLLYYFWKITTPKSPSGGRNPFAWD
jgi:hypothetical protein